MVISSRRRTVTRKPCGSSRRGWSADGARHAGAALARRDRRRPLPVLAGDPYFEGNPRDDPPGTGPSATPAATVLRAAQHGPIPSRPLAPELRAGFVELPKVALSN